MALYENTEEEREGVRRTAVYCCVSTASDLQDGSYETQVRYYRQLVEDHPGLVLAGIYGEHEKSRQHMRNRPGFMEMLLACEAGKIDVILVKSVSRFARNIVDCERTLQMLRGNQKCESENRGTENGETGKKKMGSCQIQEILL